jgi:hypothetical protein
MWNKAASESQQWIPNEIVYSLRNKTRGDRTSKTNGMWAVALPDIRGSYDYAVTHLPCGVRSWQTDTFFRILKKNMFNRNPKSHTFCSSCSDYHHQGWDHSYIRPVKWSDFISDPNAYFERAADRVPGSGVARGGSPRSPTLAGLASWRLSEG